MQSSSPNGWTATLELTRPSLDDNRADADRLRATLEDIFGAESVDIDIDLVRQLPEKLRQWDYTLRCLCFNDYGRWRLTGIKSADDPPPFVGLAVDLGTTRVVLRLINLDSGETIQERAFDNPQIEVGPDILTRIHFADEEGG